MKLLEFPIIKLTLFLIMGILLASYFEIPITWLVGFSGLLFLLIIIIYISKRKAFGASNIFGGLVYVMMICLGMITVFIHHQPNSERHYSHFISEEKPNQTQFILSIREVLKPTPFQHKYIADIIQMDDEIVTGKLLLNVQKDSVYPAYHVDDKLMMVSELEVIPIAKNPYQFDYNRYMALRYVYHQIHTDSDYVFSISSDSESLAGYADRVRNHINEKLKAYDFQENELAIINALLLGQRRDISKDLYDSYSNAGVIHVLAVSGLHVGIILLFLNFVFRPIERLKHGRYIKIALILICLWSFAIIAGLSASVTRAVTMFSIVAVGMNLHRKTNIFNTLAISMFILLLLKPNFLFDVGFQMSYLAVFAIVSIQPKLIGLWNPPYRVVDYFWQIFTVTLAAQIGVAPISLFYFHQFPALFFISNLVIIPVLGLVLGYGILMILLALLNILPKPVADLYGWMIDLMNGFIEFVSTHEGFVFRDISFSIWAVLLSYLLIILTMRYFTRPKFINLMLVLFGILMVQTYLLVQKFQVEKDEFVIFHKSKSTLIGISKGDALLLAQKNPESTEQDYLIKNYKVGKDIVDIQRNNLESVYTFDNKMILVIDSLGVYQLNSFSPDIILLRDSPKINLNRLIDSLAPKQIVADGSNYKTYVKRWEATCKKRKLPFHNTNEMGAFIID